MWVGHPYFDVVDNSTGFEGKIRRVIALICKRIGRQVGADIDDRLKAQSKKRRFLVRSLPDIKVRDQVPYNGASDNGPLRERANLPIKDSLLDGNVVKPPDKGPSEKGTTSQQRTPF